MRSGVWRRRLPLLGVLAALGLRLAGLTTRPIWYDEAFAILFSSAGPQAMQYGTLASGRLGVADVHPLGYYIVLWAWMRCFGQTIVVARLLSALLGALTVLGVLALGRSLFDEGMGWWFAVVIALAPFPLHYAQEIRMYALLALALVGATLGMWHGWRRQARWGWWLFALGAAVAQYAHTLAAVFLLPLALSPLWTGDRRAMKNTFLAAGGAVLLYFPWLVHLPAQIARVQRAYWVPKPSLVRPLTTLLAFVAGLPVLPQHLPWALFAVLSLTVLAGRATWRAWRTGHAEVRRAAWLGYLAGAPTLLLWALSQYRPVYLERILLPAGVMFLLWMAWALARAPLPSFMRRMAGGALLAVFALGWYTHLNYQGFPYGPYADLAHSLQSRWQPGDAIVHSNKLSFFPMVVYEPQLPQTYLADPPGSGSDTLARPTQEVLGYPSTADLETATRGAQRVWFVIFRRASEEYRQQGITTHPHLAWLKAHYALQAREDWGSLEVYLFRR